MKRIMEKRFMLVGTLEEAEYNRVVSPCGEEADDSLRGVIGTMARLVVRCDPL